MSGRRLALVVASQCEALPELAFLPQGGEPVDLGLLPRDRRLVLRLRDLLTGPAGDFDPVDVEGMTGPGLLVNPTQAVADAVLLAALRLAHERQAVVLLHFVGHGAAYLRDPADRARHLLHVWDTVAEPTDTEPESRGWDPYGLIDRRRGHCRDIAGLMLLVDACRASWAAPQVAGWGGVSGGLVSAWLAASGDESAWDGCLTKTLVGVLERGLAADEHPRGLLVAEVTVTDLELVAEAWCTNQRPGLGGYQSHNPVLHVGRNLQADVLADELGLGATDRALRLRLIADYIDVSVAAVEDAVGSSRVVAVVGGPGTGKSTLAAALLSPPAHAKGVAFGLVQAAAFVSTAVSVPDLARVLHPQLSRLPGFEAAARWFRTANAERWELLSPWEQLVTGPLEGFRQPVRLLFDGLDQIAGRPQHAEVVRALADLVADPALGHVSLMLTGRTVPEVLKAATVAVPELQDAAVVAYLSRRGVPTARHGRLAELAEGNWLLLKLLADLETTREGAAEDADWNTVYESVLGAMRSRHGLVADALVSVLAAADVGPVLPFDLLTAAASGLVPEKCSRTLAVEVLGDKDLYPLVDRARPGTGDERLGMFHHTLVVHVENHSPFEPVPTHRAIIEAIDQVAAASRHNPKDYRDDPVLAYAFDAGPRHHQQADDLMGLVADLVARVDPNPRVNLARWMTWAPTIQARLGADHPDTLTTRLNLARWTGNAGDPAKAREALAKLLPDMVRVLGADHPTTLSTRNNLAIWIGEAGDQQGARQGFAALIPDRVRVLGADHPDTLRTRNNLAGWTGLAGNPVGAREAFAALLPDMVRVLGADHPDTLTTRNNLALWIGAGEDLAGAREAFAALLPDRVRVLGDDHPDTLRTRADLAFWTGRAGDPAEAREALANLLPDVVRVLGADHPTTLATRHNLARWMGEAGDVEKAREAFAALLPDMVRVLGADHPNTLRTRQFIAYWTAKSGDRGADALYAALIPDMVRVLGADHPDTLRARKIRALQRGPAGDPVGAREAFAALLPDMVRVVGADHPETLSTRSSLAAWTGAAGDAVGAREAFAALLPDMVRVLGADHPDTLTTRNNLALWIGAGGDLAGAREAFAALLPDMARVLGADDPATLSTRQLLADLTSEPG
jgi:NACHT domain/Tetratricopeptide repeat